MHRPQLQQKRIPWWLWPNVLNLDAPIVAVLWQELFARLAEISLAAEHRWLLALAVWQVYFVDRWLDARRDGSAETERHRFHGRIGAGIWIVEAMALPASLYLAWRCLTPGGWTWAAALLALTGACFAVTHLGKSRLYRALPKELWVGTIFAAGCALQPWTLTFEPRGLMSVWITLFAALCFFNCAGITFWENQRADRQNPRSLLNQWPKLARYFPLCCWLVGFLAIRIGVIHPTETVHMLAAAAVFLSALTLAFLHRAYTLERARALRALADVALLTPLPVVFL